MAFCINCGQELVDKANFCSNCGVAVNGGSSSSQRKIVYEGSLHKCPNCGEVLKSFVVNCPVCGHEIRDAQGVLSVKQLAMQLEQIEAKRIPKKSPGLLALAFGKRPQLQNVDEQKIDLIKNYLIPNTKEDVLEFIVLAAANIDLKAYGVPLDGNKNIDPARREVSDAWLAKLEQATQKAEILFGQTQEYLSIRNVYENKTKAVRKQKQQIIWLMACVYGSLLVMGVLMLLSRVLMSLL